MDGLDGPPALKLRATPDEARRIAIDPGMLSALMLSYGSMDVRWFQPEATDPQTPHDRDEVYVVVSGHGTFMRALRAGPFEEAALPLAEERVPFGPGDVLLVPAGAEHRFEDFTTDFSAWAIFHGPEGGQL